MLEEPYMKELTYAAEEVLRSEQFKEFAQDFIQSEFDMDAIEALRSVPGDIGLEMRREAARIASEKIVVIDDDPIEQQYECCLLEDFLFDELNEPCDIADSGGEPPVDPAEGFNEDFFKDG